MSRSLRHGALAATAIVFSIASLTACGAGNDAATLKVRPDSAATTIGDISIQNANVITQPELTAEGPAVVSATLFNNGTKPQTLEAVTLPGSSASVQLHAAKGSGQVVVPAGGSVVLGGKGNAAAVIENSREAAKAGNMQPVVFKFSSAGEVPLNAAVVPAESYFTDFGPSTLPVAPQQSAESTPTDSASGAPEGAGAPGESGSDKTTPSDAASASAESN
ncbi:copper chaperone PCu(A)C [Streptomyces sp. NPDC001880]